MGQELASCLCFVHLKRTVCHFCAQVKSTMTLSSSSKKAGSENQRPWRSRRLLVLCGCERLG